MPLYQSTAYYSLLWRLSQAKAMHIAFPNAYFDSLGLPRLAAR